MRRPSAIVRALVLGLTSTLFLAASANATEVRVMISGGLTPAFAGI